MQYPFIQYPFSYPVENASIAVVDYSASNFDGSLAVNRWIDDTFTDRWDKSVNSNVDSYSFTSDGNYATLRAKLYPKLRQLCFIKQLLKNTYQQMIILC